MVHLSEPRVSDSATIKELMITPYSVFCVHQSFLFKTYHNALWHFRKPVEYILNKSPYLYPIYLPIFIVSFNIKAKYSKFWFKYINLTFQYSNIIFPC